MAKSAINVEFDDKALNAQLKSAINRNPKAATKAVTAIALDLSGKSARRAPIETGDLRSDCNAKVNGATVFEKQKPTGSAASLTLKPQGLVGYSLPYALRQHEDLALRHSGPEHGKVDGGEAKYLEKPFKENLPRYINLLKKIPEEAIK